MIKIKTVAGGVLYTATNAVDVRAAVEEAVAARANLADAYLAGADLADAYLAGADLAGADLAGAYLARAYLARADLARANLARANLAGANLAGAYLARAYLADAYLAGANLADAYLARANLARAYLADADLARADLADADLAGADLADADLADANLAGANLAGAEGLNPHRVNDLLILREQVGKIRAYKLVAADGEGPFKGGITYAVGGEYEVANPNTDESKDCGAGINLATLPWCLREWRDGYRILVAEFTAKDIAAIPIGNGKFRVSRCRIVKELDVAELLAVPE